MGWKNRIGLLVFLGVIVAVPFVMPENFYILTPIGVLALMTVGLSLVFGYAGQISLGHAAFFAVGAYTSGALTVHLEVSPWLAMPAGAVLSAVLALVVGIPALRLRGHYLAMATLAFGEIARVILDAWVPVTGGPEGLTGIPALTLGGLSFDPWSAGGEQRAFYLVWGAVAVGVVLALRLVHSRSGRALRAIHDDALAAETLGVPTASVKVRVFVLSAVYASVAGSLYAHYQMVLSPSAFGVMTSIDLVLMVVIGGMGSVWGAIAGTLLIAMLPEWMAALENWRLVVYGLLLLLVVMWVPQGVFLGVRDIVLWVWQRLVQRRNSELSEDGA